MAPMRTPYMSSGMAGGSVAGVGPGGDGATPARHTKGCNCKKSTCLKKYCECFQVGVPGNCWGTSNFHSQCYLCFL